MTTTAERHTDTVPRSEDVSSLAIQYAGSLLALYSDDFKANIFKQDTELRADYQALGIFTDLYKSGYFENYSANCEVSKKTNDRLRVHLGRFTVIRTVGLNIEPAETLVERIVVPEVDWDDYYKQVNIAKKSGLLRGSLKVPTRYPGLEVVDTGVMDRFRINGAGIFVDYWVA